MSIHPDKEIILKYTLTDEAYYFYSVSQFFDLALFKRIEKVMGPQLADNTYVMLQHAEFNTKLNPHLLTIASEDYKEGLRLQKELKPFGDLMTLHRGDIREVSFTIEGRKITTKHAQVKWALVQALQEIRGQNFIEPEKKKTTRPIETKTMFIKNLIPLAKFLKNEHSFINANIYRCIQELLLLKGHDADLDLIRKRLYKSLEPE